MKSDSQIPYSEGQAFQDAKEAAFSKSALTVAYPLSSFPVCCLVGMLFLIYVQAVIDSAKCQELPEHPQTPVRSVEDGDT